jgi:hypothetical protein
MQPCIKSKACAGIGISIKPARMMVCIALIMPHNCYIDPAIRSEMTKLPDETEFIIWFALLVDDFIYNCVAGSI